MSWTQQIDVEMSCTTRNYESEHNKMMMLVGLSASNASGEHYFERVASTSPRGVSLQSYSKGTFGGQNSC